MQPNPSQSSFIPKRGASHPKRKKSAKKIFLFSLIAYSLVFAALLASAASYFYKNYTTSLLQDEVRALDSQINTFSISDLSVISEFDITLQRATSRITNTASIVSALNAIESATAQPAQITSLTMERVEDQHMLLIAEIVSQSFDSALFQRNLLTDDQNVFQEISVKDVSITTLAVGEGSDDDRESLRSTSPSTQPVAFTVTMKVPIDDLPYDTTQFISTDAPLGTDNQTAL